MIHKLEIDRSVVGWVTTSEYLLLYVLPLYAAVQRLVSPFRVMWGFLGFLLRCANGSYNTAEIASSPIGKVLVDGATRRGKADGQKCVNLRAIERPDGAKID